MVNELNQENLDEMMALIEEQGSDLDMDLAEEEQAPEQSIKVSQVLEKLDKTRQPKEGVICRTCPHSMWFASPAEVKCYCRVMYLVSWSNNEPNEITVCDGPQLLG